jgi:hypothetical protein
MRCKTVSDYRSVFDPEPMLDRYTDWFSKKSLWVRAAGLVLSIIPELMFYTTLLQPTDTYGPIALLMILPMAGVGVFMLVFWPWVIILHGFILVFGCCD